LTYVTFVFFRCVNVHALHLCYRTVSARSKILFLGYFPINLLTYQTLSVSRADKLTTFTCQCLEI